MRSNITKEKTTTQSRQNALLITFMSLQQSQNCHFSTVTVVFSYILTESQLRGWIPLSLFGPYEAQKMNHLCFPHSPHHLRIVDSLLWRTFRTDKWTAPAVSRWGDSSQSTDRRAGLGPGGRERPGDSSRAVSALLGWLPQCCCSTGGSIPQPLWLWAIIMERNDERMSDWDDALLHRRFRLDVDISAAIVKTAYVYGGFLSFFPRRTERIELTGLVASPD